MFQQKITIQVIQKHCSQMKNSDDRVCVLGPAPRKSPENFTNRLKRHGARSLNASQGVAINLISFFKPI